VVAQPEKHCPTVVWLAACLTDFFSIRVTEAQNCPPNCPTIAPLMDCRWTADDLAKGLFYPVCEKYRELQKPVFVAPLFGLEVDFWTVFGRFWWFLEVAWLSFYEFIELFNF
jgi:hypothetical protein